MHWGLVPRVAKVDNMRTATKQGTIQINELSLIEGDFFFPEYGAEKQSLLFHLTSEQQKRIVETIRARGKRGFGTHILAREGKTKRSDFVNLTVRAIIQGGSNPIEVDGVKVDFPSTSNIVRGDNGLGAEIKVDYKSY